DEPAHRFLAHRILRHQLRMRFELDGQTFVVAEMQVKRIVAEQRELVDEVEIVFVALLHAAHVDHEAAMLELLGLEVAHQSGTKQDKEAQLEKALPDHIFRGCRMECILSREHILANRVDGVPHPAYGARWQTNRSPTA